MGDLEINHFACPTCERLCSAPWEAAWCMHNENPQPRPPEWIGSDWERMLPVERVWTLPLPSITDEWYVKEHRNRFGYPNNEIPGKDKAGSKVVAGPLSKEGAYAYAEKLPRDNVPRHVHYFQPVPGDLV